MYTVGQVLYFILAKKNQVYPMQVVEIITKRTLSGEDVSFVLQAGPEKETKVMFEQVDGEVFDSPELLKQTLIHRATLQVGKLIDNAVSKSETWYLQSNSSNKPRQQPQTIQNLPEFITKTENQAQQQKFEDEDDSTVTMPDGSVMRVRLPSIIRQ
jgi:hypothetical protein